MSADIVNIADRRKKKPPPSPQEVVGFCIGDVMESWEQSAKSNRLSEFFALNATVYVKPNINYLANLQEIAHIEQMMGLLPGVWGPGVNGPSQIGWRACFRFGDVLVETPDMASEGYARCCNILIFLRLKRAMAELNRTT